MTSTEPPARLVLTTRRLEITPLTLPETAAFLHAPEALAEALNLAAPSLELAEDAQAHLWRNYGMALGEDPALGVWRFPWLAALRDSRIPVAFFCFWDPPEDGIAEIAYFTASNWRRMGIMRETLDAALRWSRETEGVDAIVAGTDPPNLASNRTLASVGFQRDGMFPDGRLRWRADVKD